MLRRWVRGLQLRKYFVTGLLVWVPLTITVFVIRLLVNFVDHSLVLLPRSLRPEEVLGFRIPGLGLLVVAAVLLMTGVLLTNFLGQKLMSLWEGLLARIPFLGSIYRGSRQVTETILAPGSKSFRRVVLIPWPHAQSRMLAFVTGVAPAEVEQRLGEDQVMVFVPTTPNPTSGFLSLVPRRETIELQMSVEAAFRLIVSLGVVLPDWRGAPVTTGPAPAPAAPSAPGP